ncbi:chorismate-binding protein, partial [Alicyclobacillus sp.]|uniref:chorismate-binding protein n=1 Tax=Alicyclobacillus sp. TaxID=61169 RepID=UPI0025C6111E
MSDRTRLSLSVRAESGCDPFYLYLHLTEALGAGRVFLLDAAKDVEHSQYCMSILGAVPLVEVQVKDGAVAVLADGAVADWVRGRLLEGGDLPEGDPDRPLAPSVLERVAWTGRPADPMAFLERLRAHLRGLQGAQEVPFSSGFLGYIGYDAVHYLERLPKTTEDDRGLVDIRLQWHAVVIQLQDQEVRVFETGLDADGLRDRIRAVRDLVAAYARHPVVPRLPEAPETADVPPEAHDDVTQAEFEANVERAKAYIRAGDIFQVVLSKRVRVEKRIHPYTAYDRLRKLNPSPYMFMAEYPDCRLFGASPEAQFRAVGGVAEMKPIAGTSKGRGKTPEEDARLRERLLHDEKERAEHVMLVDLCR